MLHVVTVLFCPHIKLNTIISTETNLTYKSTLNYNDISSLEIDSYIDYISIKVYIYRLQSRNECLHTNFSLASVSV